MKTKFNINISEHLHAHTLNTKTNRCTCGHSVRKQRGFLTHLLEELHESTFGFSRALSNAHDEGYEEGFADGHMT
jgi:hypothetical protein